jgi:hypothetical protein
LDKIDINLVKQYIELLLIILEEIKLLYEWIWNWSKIYIINI